MSEDNASLLPFFSRHRPSPRLPTEGAPPTAAPPPRPAHGAQPDPSFRARAPRDRPVPSGPARPPGPKGRLGLGLGMDPGTLQRGFLDAGCARWAACRERKGEAREGFQGKGSTEAEAEAGEVYCESKRPPGQPWQALSQAVAKRTLF